jgi:uncharacterized membrane protein
MIFNKNFIKKNKQRTILWSIMILFGLIYSAIVISNHYYFRTFALDYGFYNQAFWGFAHFGNYPNTVFEPQLNTFFQVHPAFTLIVLSPLYWVFHWAFSTYTLLVIQNIFLMIGGYGTYLIVKHKTQDFWLGVLALFHYFIIWGHIGALSADYIDTTVAASVVPLFLYFFDRKKYLVATICFLFIIIAKENMPIWFIFISLTLILLYWKDKKSIYYSLGYIAFSLAYLVFLNKMFIPSMQDPNLPYWGFTYSALGNNINEAIVFIFSHPFKTLELFFINNSGDPTFNGIKAEFYFVFLISGGVVLFFNPKYFLMFIPVIAQKVLNDLYLRWGIYSFYSIEIVSILSLAVFLIIGGLKNKRTTKILGILLCVITTATTFYLFGNNHRKLPWYDSTKEKFYDSKMYKAEFNVKKVYAAFAKIPDDAKVCATETVVPHLAFRKEISIFPYVRNADYIFLLLCNSPYPLTQEQFDVKLNEYIANKDWGILWNDYPVLILKKDSLLHKNNAKYISTPKSIICKADSLSKSKEYFYSNDATQMFSNANVQSGEKSFSGKFSVKLTRENPYGLTTVLKNITAGSRFKVSVWRYSENNDGCIVASGKTGDDFYSMNGENIVDTRDGWKLIQMDIVIHMDLPDHELKLYLWNKGNTAVFFDDFSIEQIR